MTIPHVFLSSGAQRVKFLVDTGSSFTLLSAWHAKQLQADVCPGGSYFKKIWTLAGPLPVKVRLATIRVWWNDSQQGDPFVWPALILDTMPADPILGLNSIPGSCRWTFDGGNAADRPPKMTLTDIRY